MAPQILVNHTMLSANRKTVMPGAMTCTLSLPRQRRQVGFILTCALVLCDHILPLREVG